MSLFYFSTKRPFKQLALIFSVALLGGGLGCYCGIKMTARMTCPRCCADRGVGWLRSQLNTTESQNKQLDLIDQSFDKREQKLQTALSDANRALGKTIVAERDFTPKVSHSVEAVHHAMAELQKASLEHIFDMKEALHEDQYDRLLEIAGSALGK